MQQRHQASFPHPRRTLSTLLTVSNASPSARQVRIRPSLALSKLEKALPLATHSNVQPLYALPLPLPTIHTCPPPPARHTSNSGKPPPKPPPTGAATLHGFVALRRELAERGVILLDLNEVSINGIADAIVKALLAKKVLPPQHAANTLAALKAHHHHAQTKERHAMLESRAHRRMEASLRNFRRNTSTNSISKIRTQTASEDENLEQGISAVAELVRTLSHDNLINDPDPDSADHDDDAFVRGGEGGWAGWWAGGKGDSELGCLFAYRLFGSTSC